MSLRFVLKLTAALCVCGIIAFTALLGYHVMVRPLGGIFAKAIPKTAEATGLQDDAALTKTLDATKLPDIDPGEKSFQKAHELLALGQLAEAREKLNSIITSYPSSSSAPSARRIVGEMNLDEILSAHHMEGKKSHIVARGNSFLGIASEYRTSLDLIIHLNGMLDFKGLQPGEELIVMPLDYRVLIEPQRKSISLWEGTRFIRDYPILNLAVSGKLLPTKTKVGAKFAEHDGRPTTPQSKDYRGANKVIQLAKPALKICGASEADATSAHGIVLRTTDMEELNLLTRVGNEVEIR